MLRKLSAIAALLTGALASAPAAAATYSAFYVFGDSLSDVGNVYIATGGAEPASPPYFYGEFSNGPNWVEDLSVKLGLGVVLPSSAPLNGTDYAWGGATTGLPATDNPAPTVPNGYQQVMGFLAARSGSAPSSALYTVTLGGNDLSNILTSFLGGGVSGSVASTEAMQAAAAEAFDISRLVAAGAKTIVVPFVGDIGKTPGVIALGATAVAEGTFLTSTYNHWLDTDLSGVSGVHFLNTIALLDAVEANPSKYGFADLTDPCYVGPYTGGGTVCANPDAYLFWDTIHPSAAADAFIADAAAAMLAPSPRPGAGLFSLGLLLLIGLKNKRA